MKVFKTKDYDPSNHNCIIYNLIAANSKETTLEIINHISKSPISIEDIIEIPELEYEFSCPRVIYTIGGNIKREFFKG